jgi:hypothetical protein
MGGNNFLFCYVADFIRSLFKQNLSVYMLRISLFVRSQVFSLPTKIHVHHQVTVADITYLHEWCYFKNTGQR